MNDDQVDGLNSSTYWRDRNEKESQEKRTESRKMMREILKWWTEKDRWMDFAKSYPQRFALTLHLASLQGKVEYLADAKLYKFEVDGVKVELGVEISQLPDWPTKDTFEKVESAFTS
jgi:hypothetical protein